MSFGERFANAARTFVDVPFHHQGRSRSGIDCAGLLSASARAVGLVFEDCTDYRRFPNDGELMDYLSRAGCTLVDAGQMVVGDVLVFGMGRRKRLQHAGIYLGNDQMIHACEGYGKVVIHGLAGMWKQKLCAVVRFAERV